MQFQRLYHKLNIYFSVGILGALLIVMTLVWLMLIDPMLTSENQEIQSRLQALTQESQQISYIEGQPHKYIYEDGLQTLSPRQVVQKLLSSVSGVTMTGFKKLGITPITMGVSDFSALNNEAGIDLQPVLYKNKFEIKLSGDFLSVLAYMKKINESNYPIYWESVQYDVAYSPMANVTLKAFTLRESK